MRVTNTTSSIISFAGNLEDKSSEFYSYLSQQYPTKKEVFLDFIKENKKNKKQIIRTYQETISDALEASFVFNDLNTKDYYIDTKTENYTSLSEALEMAIKMEKITQKFYYNIAKLSKSLLATIPRIFKKVAERKSKRKLKLELLINGLL